MIGPSFPSELEAEGLLTLPFAWGADGTVQYSAAITTEQRTAIEAVIAAHDHTDPAPDAVTVTSLAAAIEALTDRVEAVESEVLP